MLQKSLLLLAAAGLLVFAVAGPRADLVNPPTGRDVRRQLIDSVRMLPPGARQAALQARIDANRVIQHVRRGQKSEILQRGPGGRDRTGWNRR